jgi:lipopolysaccharide/colanic/teichoic acid biosynthesis glycosyltransferase
MNNNNYVQLDKKVQEYFKDKPIHSKSVKINHAVKRTLDVVLGSVGLILSAPLVATLAAVTLYDSGSPAFFKQERIGYRGQHITIYKIRTMHNGVDEKVLNGELKLQEIYSDSHNSHVYTRFGRMLDYTHLNELPQLWNVIKGEMSIVGNRPVSSHHLQLYGQFEGYVNRFDSKPGLLGYSQLQSRPIDYSKAVIEEGKYSKIYNNGNVLLEDWKIFSLTLKKFYKVCKIKTTQYCATTQPS